jgi:hypothetical protein
MYWKGVVYKNVDSCKINVFELRGALDVPGGGTYTYTAVPSGGTFVAPTGGALASGSTPSAAQITWNNEARVGYANYQAAPGYLWLCGVNVVKVAVVSSSIVYSAKATQYARSNPLMISAGPFGPGMSATVAISLQGPLKPGWATERGVKYIQVGGVQNGQFYSRHTAFADGECVMSNLEGNTWYLDAPSGAATPWYNPKPGSLDKAVADPVSGVATLNQTYNALSMIQKDHHADDRKEKHSGLYDLEFRCNNRPGCASIVFELLLRAVQTTGKCRCCNSRMAWWEVCCRHKEFRDTNDPDNRLLASRTTAVPKIDVSRSASKWRVRPSGFHRFNYSVYT